MPKFTGSDQAASVRVYQRGVALIGKGLGWVEAGHEHGNFQRQSRAAPDGVLCFFRRAHSVSRQNILRPKNVARENSADESCDICPVIMLDHKKAAGTEFRFPRF